MYKKILSSTYMSRCLKSNIKCHVYSLLVTFICSSFMWHPSGPYNQITIFWFICKFVHKRCMWMTTFCNIHRIVPCNITCVFTLQVINSNIVMQSIIMILRMKWIMQSEFIIGIVLILLHGLHGIMEMFLWKGSLDSGVLIR